MHRYPDEPRPSVTVSIDDFNRRAQHIMTQCSYNNVEPPYSKPLRIWRFVRFVLAGRDSNECEDVTEQLCYDSNQGPFKEQARIILNPSLDHQSLATDNITITRNIASTIGITRDLPYNSTVSLSIYPVPNSDMTMVRENWNHLYYDMFVEGVRSHSHSARCHIDALLLTFRQGRKSLCIAYQTSASGV